jgi:DNA adenine methylase
MGGTPPHRFPSPLRYPGGKGKIANFVKLLMLENRLVGSAYAEPYAGGASVALSLLYEEFASHVFINDINKSLAAFWRCVLTDADGLCELIRSTPVTIDTWHRQRDVIASTDVSDLDLAFATFFLNRTNRSGILDAGVIGGQAQDGKWRLDARYNVDDLCRRIRKIYRFRSRITFTESDAEDFLENLPTEDRLVYLDPPYYVKGADLYINSYNDEDHQRLAAVVHQLPEPWMISYDACDRIGKLYGAKGRIEYSLSYSASSTKEGVEWLYLSPSLTAPHVDMPTRIPRSHVDAARQSGL